MDDPYDAVIVGGGPAGLTAAIYLGRFRRRFLVIDGGDSRLSWIPRTHNHPGFPEGVPGADLLSAMREQSVRYGAEFRPGMVTRIEAQDGLFQVETADGAVTAARHVILCTGVCDNDVDVPDMKGAVRKGLLRMCPICDGYEVIDEAVGVIGDGPHGAREAQFMRTYTGEVTLIHVGPPDTLDADCRAELETCGIALIETPIGAVTVEADRIRAVDFGEGDVRRFDTVYSAMGTTPASDLAIALGAACDAGGCLKVDDHQRTSVPGLYAAGDLVRGLNQISIAQAEAAIAATDVHNRLRAR